MKLIHTSDWHLGQNFYGYDRDDEHRSFFSQLAAIMKAEKPDALVVSGDIFNNPAPTAVAQRLLVDGVMMLHDASPDTTIVITAGNHDSGVRLEAERELWRRLGIHVIGSCSRRDDGTFDAAQFIVEIENVGSIIAVPFFHPSNFPRASVDTERANRQQEFFASLSDATKSLDVPVVLMAHMAVEGCNTRGHEDVPVGGMFTEKLTDLGESYDYLALGHIHMPQTITTRAHYCGSPIPLSFSEEYPHYVNIVEIARRNAEPQIRRVKIETTREVVTIPRNGATFDEALKALAAFDAADCSYVRMLVDQDEPIPADAEERARLAVEGKACHFCEVRRKPRAAGAVACVGAEIDDVDDFTMIRPIEIAVNAYERIEKVPMNQQLIELIETAINKASQSHEDTETDD